MEASTTQQFELVAKLDQEKNKTERLKSLCRKLLKKLSNASGTDPTKQQSSASQNISRLRRSKDIDLSHHREEVSHQFSLSLFLFIHILDHERRTRGEKGFVFP